MPRKHPVLVRDGAYRFAGNAARKDARRDVSRDHTARRDDGVGADGHASAYRRRRRHPHIVANDDGAGVFPIVHAVLVFVDGSLLPHQRVHRSRHRDTRAEHDVVAYLYRCDVKKLAVEIHIEVLAERDVEAVLNPDVRLEKRAVRAVREDPFDEERSERDVPRAGAVEDVDKISCAYASASEFFVYGVMPKRNNTNLPQSNSFRRFCTAETCQYVYYCLRSARAKSSENLLL